MTALTFRPDLDQLRCSDCDEGEELVMYPPCHTKDLTIATYRKGELALECAECGRVYLRVLVAG